MFTLSRGAYIVRSVAGLINNCGIIIPNPANTALIDQAYSLYRNPHPIHHPSSPEMVDFRSRVSHAVRTPIKFMGIFDTVGSRGIPRLNYDTGTGFEWPEFYDNVVSTVVEKVYHALAIHDRFWIFEPCLASRDPRHTALANLRISQKWFLGCHYDLARQEFQFFREGGSWLEAISFPVLNLFSKTVTPNHKLADMVLIWMLKGIRAEGGGDIIGSNTNGPVPLIPIQTAIDNTIQRLINQSPTGTGDMYADIVSYLPGGRFFSPLVNWLGRLDETPYAILFKPVERMIPDHGMNSIAGAPIWNQVYDYDAPDTSLPGHPILRAIADIDVGRYPSRTLEKFVAYMNGVGRPWRG
ncbi:uncharacterized protein B0I36DRAFT_343045 [Microdochium trichocladiopsis]|uniref:T6SS Phospholipase effector Tle1-like catalytic domain-containing protein n=1 Tax=Microdochium trichocladiopsis TaxID=1682393 RepID=A0A9P9BGX0_9PEZI|nr:uncharacterized protein B0I36DRAFT_343045 [Microdochium trichocladiopsis]KAH7007929.1 hypothetical protein B0I36DRAFT_343045 [Microdochium trichocladiopsis]